MNISDWLKAALFLVACAVLLFLPVWSAIANRKTTQRTTISYYKLMDFHLPLDTAMRRVEHAASLPDGAKDLDTHRMASTTRTLLEQMVTIVERVNEDKLSCVRPLAGAKETVPTARIVLPGQNPFGAENAVLDSTTGSTVRNELLITLRQLREEVLRHLNGIAVTLSTPSDSGRRIDVAARIVVITKATARIDELMIDLQMQLQVNCAEQRDRFRTSQPHLSSYEFDTLSVHARDTLPQYEFGRAAITVPRTTQPASAHPDPAYQVLGRSTVPRSDAVRLCVDPQTGVKRWCENPAEDALMEIVGSDAPLADAFPTVEARERARLAA